MGVSYALWSALVKTSCAAPSKNSVRQVVRDVVAEQLRDWPSRRPLSGLRLAGSDDDDAEVRDGKKSA